MTAIEKKSLSHILTLLESFETYKVYMAVRDLITSAPALADNEKTIMQALEKAMGKEVDKMKEAKEWIKTLLIEN